MSKKRTSLQSVTSRPVPASSGEVASSTASESMNVSPEQNSAYVPPSRRGRKALTVHLDPAAIRQIKHIAADEDTTTQALVSEALNELFRSRGKSRIA